jgi:methylmalonyl-CoA mutase C-terminal domain/subunit
MANRKGRILLGKLGEGHKDTQLKLAKSLSEAGFEVIFTDLQEPDAIVHSALQESVDHIGITTLAGAEVGVFQEIMDLLSQEDAAYVSVTAGGVLDDADIPRLEEMGVMAFFPEGTTFAELVAWSRAHITVKQEAW